MNLDQLQAELAERGCVLWVEGEMLRFRAPEGALTPPLMAQLRRQKKDLIKRLRRDEQSSGRPIKTQEPSFGQQAMWLMHQGAPESPAYNVASAVKIDSTIDFDALSRVWQTLLLRHESLRTTFETAAGQLIARVHDQPILDIAHVPACGESDEQLKSRIEVAYRAPFDLTKGPLARLRLFTAAPDRHVLLLSMHHIVLDAWSLWVLHDELGTLYQQESRGEVGRLPAVTASYGDFVRWQQEMPNTHEGRAQWENWREQLTSEPEPARLAWDRPRPARREQCGGSLHFRLPAELSDALREVARNRGATPFMTLLAIFQTLLHRHSGQTDFLIGTTTSGRSKKQFNRLVGYLVNTLPLRTEIKPGMRFSDLLEQTRETTLSAISGQDFPFPLLVERINPRREAGALPLCRVMFGLQKPHDFSEAMIALDDAEKSIDWGGLRASAFAFDQQEGQFDLTLEMYETASTFLGVLKYDTDLLDRESGQLLASRYEHLARQVVENPEQTVDDFDLLTIEDRRRLEMLTTLPPAEACFHSRLEEVFTRQAAKTPDAVAIVCEEEELSYADADRLSNQMARWLGQRGVAPGAYVACCLQRGMAAWLAHLACYKAGVVYVPLDDTGPATRLCELVRDCKASIVLSDTPTAGQLELALADLPAPLELVDEAQEEISQQSDAAFDIRGSASDAAYVIYTSGSTGQPKGVVVSHAAFKEHLSRVQEAFETTPQDRVLQFSVMTFDPSLEQAWSAWSAGAALVVRGPELWSAREFCQRLARHGVTVANIPPAYFRECSETKLRGGHDCVNLRLLIVGGDAFPLDALEPWRDGPTRVLNAYGPTEAVVTATVADMTGFDPATGPAPIGRPMAGTAAYLVDAGGRQVPIGVPGELILGGPALATGYLGDSELTEERFAPMPALTGDMKPVYRTGDLVRWNHRGQLEFLGRLDRQVKINGYRIELGEVERALKAIAGVTQAAARVQLQGDEPRLVAYYTAAAGAELCPRRLATSVRSRLPHYMTPAAMQRVDAFPRKSSGKIAIDRLPAVEIETTISSQEYAAPVNDIQRVLSEVWSEVLGIDRVGIHDDFFELGGASLKSLQIVSAAEAKGVRVADESLSPALLFEYPTIAQLAELLTLKETPLEPGVVAVG